MPQKQNRVTVTVPLGWGSWIGFIAAAAAAIAPLVGELADATPPHRVAPRIWVIVSAALLVVTVVGRMLQAAADAGRNAIGNVPIGPSTIVGFVAAAAAALIPMLGELADAAEPLGIRNTVWVIVSAVLTAVTVLGRMLQAAADSRTLVVGDEPATEDTDHDDQGDAGDTTTPGVEV